MSKPIIHAESSVRKFGGKPEDYMPVHEFMDSSKATLADNRHRALTHTSWFVSTILPRVFGETFVNSAGKTISTRDIGEQHVLEDFGGYIPTAQDFLQEIIFQPWMQNGKEPPPSSKNLEFYLRKTEKIKKLQEAGWSAESVKEPPNNTFPDEPLELSFPPQSAQPQVELTFGGGRIALQEKLLKLNTD